MNFWWKLTSFSTRGRETSIKSPKNTPEYPKNILRRLFALLFDIYYLLLIY